MTSLRIGLVVEGPTDYIMIKALLKRSLEFSHPDISLVFVDLQPSSDRTSGSPEGGWQMVYKWCERNDPEFRKVQYFGPGLFAGVENSKQCDLIVIQMDADICTAISGGGYSDIIPKDLISVQGRGKYIASVIDGWLWPAPYMSDSFHIAAPAVEVTETWLIAGLGNHPEPELIAKPLRIFAEIDFQRRGKPIPASTKAISKQPQRYEPLAFHAATNVKAIIEKCFWFSNLVQAIANQIDTTVSS